MKSRGKNVKVLLAACVLMAGLGAARAEAGPAWEFGDEGQMTVDYKVQLRAAQRDLGSGPQGDDATNDIYFRRNRLSFNGQANDVVGFSIQLEHTGGARINELSVSPTPSNDSISVIDSYLTMNFENGIKTRFGKTKEIMAREGQENCFEALNLDRSVFIPGGRGYGAVMLHNVFNDMVQYRLAVMDGQENDKLESAFRYSGRIHLSLLDPETTFGYGGSYLGEKKVLTIGAGYESEKDAVFSSFANNQGTGSEDYSAYTYDVFFEYPTAGGTVTAATAYLKTDYGDAGTRGVTAAQGAAGERNGSYYKLGYMIGKCQIFARYEDWSVASLNGVDGQNVKWTAGGFNYYFNGQDLRFTLEYSKTDLDKDDTNKDFTTVTAQLQAQF